MAKNDGKRVEVVYSEEQGDKRDIMLTDIGGGWLGVRCDIREDVPIRGGKCRMIGTGLSVTVPDGYCLLFLSADGASKSFPCVIDGGVFIVEGKRKKIEIPMVAARDSVLHRGDTICRCRCIKVSGIPIGGDGD